MVSCARMGHMSHSWCGPGRWGWQGWTPGAVRPREHKNLSAASVMLHRRSWETTLKKRVMVDAAESCVLWSQSVDIPSSGWQIIINLINVLVLYRHDSSQRGLVMGQICVIHVQRRYNWSLKPSLAETLRCKDNCEGKFVLLNTDPHYFSAGGAAAKPLVHNTHRTLLFHIKPT